MGFYEDKIFPRALDIALAGARQTRIDLVSQASGRVLEVGIGNGANLPFYSARASQVVGIEPCAAMVQMAREKLASLDRQSQLALRLDQYDLQVGSGEDLPFADASFDTAIACLVFCTIPNADKAARELYRVLKPGGQLLFFEHVQAADGVKKRLQNWMNPLWKPLACGCHLNRDTQAVFRNAGFHYDTLEATNHPRLFPLFSSVMIGSAHKETATR
jgi:ubiquinone/menaquinone biosynthesis C-methylase UbiE